MVLQMVLDGAGYAYECINITQFVYEETLQMASLGVGTALSKKNAHKAHTIMFGPYYYALNQLWNFAVQYGHAVANVWMAYLGYFVAMKGLMLMQKGQIIDGVAEKENPNTKKYGWNWKEECTKFIGWLNANVPSGKQRTKAMIQENPCTQYFKRTHNHHSPDDYDEFMILANHYFNSNDTKWLDDIEDLLTRIGTPTSEEQITLYKGQYSKKPRLNPTSKEKRQLVNDIWQKFNMFQKLAYRNQPGGHSYFGYSLLFNNLWDKNIDYSGIYTPPWFGFLQFGSEEKTDNQEYNILENKKTYRLSKDSVIVNSIEYHKGNSSFDPAAMIDLQTGDVKFLKDMEGKIEANYISGKKTLWYEEIASNPQANDTANIKTVPIRWGTLYLKTDMTYTECFAYNPLWSLLEIRFPETFTAGAKVTYSTYKPVKGIALQIIREYDDEIIWQELTKEDGTIRLGIADECGLVTLRITTPNGTIHEYKHLKPKEVAQHKYYNINNMPGD